GKKKRKDSAPGSEITNLLRLIFRRKMRQQYGIRAKAELIPVLYNYQTIVLQIIQTFSRPEMCAIHDSLLKSHAEDEGSTGTAYLSTEPKWRDFPVLSC
ncbi:MAG: hypothetical protein II781_00835, partial [Clostridia bacterium]|nr:hypothetical protein [Clostridia bacterium]